MVIIVLLMTNAVKLLLLYCEFSKLIQRDLRIQPRSRLQPLPTSSCQL